MNLERESLPDPASQPSCSGECAMAARSPAGPQVKAAAQVKAVPKTATTPKATQKAKAAPLAASEPRANRILGRLVVERAAPPPAVPPAFDGEVGIEVEAERRRGRGAVSNAAGRFEPAARILFDDGWQSLEDLPPLRTQVTEERARTVITRNQSPDVAFDRSINAYRGCEHGCVYCFARPTHAYHGLSAGLDFETKLFVKPDAPELLARELSQSSYQPRVIAMGTNTDPYQPIEKRYEVTRRLLEVLSEFGHPVGIVTKSGLVARDIDILAPMAERGLVKVAISMTTLDPQLSRTMEPRAASPHVRLGTIRRLADAGIPTAVLTAPLIPALNDMEVERILDAAKAAGASEAGYVMLRLPLEIADLFREWLVTHFPDKARHVLGLIRQMHGGKDYDSTFGKRMRGDGPYAWTVGRRFEIAARRLGLAGRGLKLTTAHFRRPKPAGVQLSLFD
ncbi:PA0069 family radical SAM protein [Xanthobacter autotrophicus]|uniref:PA0069 family radical SAM protein n=1 Tax=Xanthobacter autotrophicus TaxID=280 RepID=A0A6C1KKB4_XANAU|nr:PA0069 family radical SAM protein [Xanthobacter autotrophicus]TLX44241.1 PA0069 family radical SAM protein [Xanthobacter autotrophicus]